MQAVVRALPPGTVLRASPLVVVGHHDAEDAVFLNGLWREALRLSPCFDVAAGIEDGDAALEVTAQLDRESSTLTTTLLEAGSPPLALAATWFVPQRPAAAIADLAAATRAALSDSAAVAAVGLTYSEAKACVVATEAALTAAAEGDLALARGRLSDARRADAGCTFTMLASVELDLRSNDFARAARAAQEALQLQARSSPTTRHRLARALLLARAANDGDAASLDRQLLALGDAARQERPHDPHGTWTQAQALSLLGRFTQAEPLLAALRARWPKVTQVPYHHGLALLGCNRPADALLAFQQAQEKLSPLQVAIPRAIALWSAVRHEELSRFLDDLTTRDDVKTSGLLHHVRRMQAAHAILRDRGADAAALLLTDLEWMRQRPGRIGQHAEHLASTSHVLVLLGHAADVTRAVDAFLRLPHLDEAAKRALTFAGGLAAAATRGDVAAAEATLSKEGASSWSHALRAASHRQRGELADETRALLEAARLDRSPLLRAHIARALRAAGEHARAAELLAALRAELLQLDLRRLAAHPLVDPAHALALLATG
jgi:hypothetical protein